MDHECGLVVRMFASHSRSLLVFSSHLFNRTPHTHTRLSFGHIFCFGSHRINPIVVTSFQASVLRINPERIRITDIVPGNSRRLLDRLSPREQMHHSGIYDGEPHSASQPISHTQPVSQPATLSQSASQPNSASQSASQSVSQPPPSVIQPAS